MSLVCADGQKVVTLPRQFVDPSLMLLMTTAVVHKLLTIRLSEVNAPIRESLVIPFKFH